jgi:hypothetical protein
MTAARRTFPSDAIIANAREQSDDLMMGLRPRERKLGAFDCRHEGLAERARRVAQTAP